MVMPRGHIFTERTEAIQRIERNTTRLAEASISDEAQILAMCALIVWDCKQLVETMPTDGGRIPTTELRKFGL